MSSDSAGECRVIIEAEPASGAWNMAVDETLLESALQDGRCTVRLYRWSEATLSLGYFQRTEDADVHRRLAAVPRVRRLSGGGAILHHHELTYSCAVPAGHPLARAPKGLYVVARTAVMQVLVEAGVNLEQETTPRRVRDAALLCFHRRDGNDLVCGLHKVLGSAQRRRRGAVLQHGSLLLRRSSLAPEFPGLKDLTPVALREESLMRGIGVRLASSLAGKVVESCLSDSEQDRARELARSKYRTLVWNGRPPITVCQIGLTQLTSACVNGSLGIGACR